MRTLLGRYRRAVQMKQEEFGKPRDFKVVGRVQKSPRPDVVELGLVGKEGVMERLERGVKLFR